MVNGGKASVWLVLLRGLVLAGLAVSAALYVDYASALPTFCGEGSGCSAVRYSGYGYVFGRIPVPLAGLLGLGGLFVISLLGPSKLRDRLVVWAGYAVGVAGAGFLALQIVIGAFCWLCGIVDVASVMVAGVAWGRHRALRSGHPPAGADPLEPWSWATFGVVAVVTPLLWPQVRPQPEVPAAVQTLYVPGKINVIEFSDFECPFCRLLHKKMGGLLREYSGRVNLVRLHVPLDMHPDARAAARAAICAERQGEGNSMADELFEAQDLSPEANRELAAIVGLDLVLYDRCLADPAVDQRIERHTLLLKQIGMQGLPTVLIGSRKIVGLQDDAVYREAFAQAARNDDARGISPAIYFTFAGLIVVAAGFLGRRRRRPRRGKPAPPDPD
jgi:protein-disulfide isomerase/uncharacterized membrane protein